MAFLQQSTTKLLPIFFNVSANVGRNCPNQPEDVALVSFLLVKWVEATGGPQTKPLAARVNIGTYDQNLQALIDSLLQQHAAEQAGSTVDGHISRATPGATYNHGRSGFMICIANYHVARNYSMQWPRIDLIPGSIPAIKAIVDREIMAS